MKEEETLQSGGSGEARTYCTGTAIDSRLFEQLKQRRERLRRRLTDSVPGRGALGRLEGLGERTKREKTSRNERERDGAGVEGDREKTD